MQPWFSFPSPAQNPTYIQPCSTVRQHYTLLREEVLDNRTLETTQTVSVTLILAAKLSSPSVQAPSINRPERHLGLARPGEKPFKRSKWGIESDVLGRGMKKCSLLSLRHVAIGVHTQRTVLRPEKRKTSSMHCSVIQRLLQISAWPPDRPSWTTQGAAAIYLSYSIDQCDTLMPEK